MVRRMAMEPPPIALPLGAGISGGAIHDPVMVKAGPTACRRSMETMGYRPPVRRRHPFLDGQVLVAMPGMTDERFAGL